MNTIKLPDGTGTQGGAGYDLRTQGAVLQKDLPSK